LKKLLLFATGSTRVPAGGFANLGDRFKISWLKGARGTAEVDMEDTRRLMLGHSCFSWIELPKYSSYEVLAEQVDLAIEHGSSGYAFA
jgi:hypothetical protein